MKAQDLIDAKYKNVVEQLPPAPLLAELKKLIEYNDACTVNNARVGWQDACKLLSANGFQCGRLRLLRICAALGRKSWSKK